MNKITKKEIEKEAKHFIEEKAINYLSYDDSELKAILFSTDIVTEEEKKFVRKIITFRKQNK